MPTRKWPARFLTGRRITTRLRRGWIYRFWVWRDTCGNARRRPHRKVEVARSGFPRRRGTAKSTARIGCATDNLGRGLRRGKLWGIGVGVRGLYRWFGRGLWRILRLGGFWSDGFGFSRFVRGGNVSHYRLSRFHCGFVRDILRYRLSHVLRYSACLGRDFGWYLGTCRRVLRLGDSRGQNIHEQLDQFRCAAAVGIFVRVILRDIQRQQVLVLHYFRENGARVGEAQTAVAGHIYAGQIRRIEHVGVNMHHEFPRIGVQLRQRILRGLARALELDVRHVNVADRRTREKFLLGRIEPLQAKEQNVRLAHQRAVAPETRQLWRALADNIRHHHAVDAAGRGGRGSVQVGVAIDPQ